MSSFEGIDELWRTTQIPAPRRRRRETIVRYLVSLGLVAGSQRPYHNRTDWRDRPPPWMATIVDDFSVSLKGITETDAAGIREFCTTIAMTRTCQATHNSYKAICIARLPRTARSKTNDP